MGGGGLVVLRVWEDSMCELIEGFWVVAEEANVKQALRPWQLKTTFLQTETQMHFHCPYVQML